MESDKIRTEITRLLKWAEVHARTILVGAAVVIVCGFGWWYCGIFIEEKRF